MQKQMRQTFQTRHALLRSLVPRYQQASSAQKTLLLDAFGKWTGYTRKYAIKLLNHGELDQQTIQRHRQPQYGQEVQQALFLSWKAAHYICAKRLLPSRHQLILWFMRLPLKQVTQKTPKIPLSLLPRRVKPKQTTANVYAFFAAMGKRIT